MNCGIPATNRETWRQVARATAAHSTVTVNDTSSVRFLESGALRQLASGAPIIGGLKDVRVSRDERADSVVLHASHDGYADRFHVIHHRSLVLASDGSRLEGEDTFELADPNRMPDNGSDEFAVRFHLHPSVKANRLTDGHGVMLLMPDREVWTFNASEEQVEIEESVYLAGADGPRRTVQIVIYGRARKGPTVRWAFVHMTRATSGERMLQEHQPELPL